MRYCKFCGADLPEDASFCGKCGRVVTQPVYGSEVQVDNSQSPVPPANRSARRPYQYTPITPANSQGAYASSANEQRYGPSSYSPGPPPPAVPQSYPAQPPLVIGNADPSQPSPTRPGRPGRRRGCMIGCLGALLLLIILLGFAFTTLQKVLAFGSAISTQSPLSTQTSYMGTSDRVNILIMGYGGAGHDGAYLTDSLVLMSLLPQSHHTTLISIPRDLWVQYPPNSGNYTKINSIYTLASNSNANPVAGGDALVQKVSLVTGLDVKYWMTINFAGFRKFIDAIGGVDVNVPDAFTARYPKNDDPSINASWITVHFNKGMQHMDGATAIVYARARYVTDNPAEGTDFARSARQQLIMKSALAKLKDWHTWFSLYGALDALKGTLYSNLSLADLAQFALKMDLNNAHRFGLANYNVLMDSSAGGQYILLPRNDDWQLIKDFIKQQLYN
ncbi:MAG TPA: LCP family protein [Ktedonobacteraceae bacterium]|nr:LCP family protein [Ktedonobacteraceae bacterium]